MKAEFKQTSSGNWLLVVTPDSDVEVGVFDEIKTRRVRLNSWRRANRRFSNFSLIFEEGEKPPRLQCPCCDGTEFPHTRHWCPECDEMHSEETLINHALNAKYKK